MKIKLKKNNQAIFITIMMNHYHYINNGLIDSIRTTLNRFVSHDNSKEQLDILSMFLAIRIHDVT
jgi:hypothetical protein